MASLAISTTLTLSLLLLFLLTLASAQANPGSYDISVEQGWDKFVKDAAKGTGGTPINMDEFVTRVNNNMKNGGDEEVDPGLLEDLKSFNGKNDSSAFERESTNSSSVESEISSEPTAAMDDLATARMIASVNGGSLAPESNAKSNGALHVKAIGVVGGLLPIFAASFVLH